MRSIVEVVTSSLFCGEVSTKENSLEIGEGVSTEGWVVAAILSAFTGRIAGVVVGIVVVTMAVGEQPESKSINKKAENIFIKG